MSRRSLFSNRSSLSRRVMNMMSSLFRRRWAAPSRVSRRGRLLSRIREMADDLGDVMAQTATRTVARAARNTHLLTLGAPEFLEPRKVMAVYSDASFGEETGVLAAWIDQSSEQLDVFSTDGAGRITICSTVGGVSTELFDSTRTSPGQTLLPTKVMLYEENFFTSNTITLSATQNTTANATLNFGGTGYTSSPTVNLVMQDPAVGANVRATYGVPAVAQSYLTLTAAPGTATATGTTFTTGSTINVTQYKSSTGFSGGVAANAVLTLQSSGAWNVTSSDPDFTTFGGVNVAVTATSTGNAVTGLTLSGRVNRFDIRNSLQFMNTVGGANLANFANVALTPYSGYYGDVFATFSGGGGSGAQVFVDLDEGSYTTTSVVMRPPVGSGASNPITQAVYVGSADGRYTRFDTTISGFNAFTGQDVDTVSITTPITTPTTGTYQNVNIRNVGTYTQNSAVDANTSYFIRTLGTGSKSISVGGDIDAAGVTMETLGGMYFSAGNVTSTGGITLDNLNNSGDIVAVGRQFTATGAILFDAEDFTAASGTGNIAITLSSGQVLRAAGLMQLRADDDLVIDGTGSVSSTGSSVFLTSDRRGVTVAGSSFTANNGDIDLQATTDATLDIATSGRYVRVVSDTTDVTLAKNVNSTGAIFIQSGGNIVVSAGVSGSTNVSLISSNLITGVSTIAADRLTVSQGGSSSPLVLNTSANRLTSTSGNDTAYTNNKSLVLEGAYVTGGNLTVDVTGGSSTLTVATPIDLSANPNAKLTLNSSGSLSALVAINAANDVYLSSVNGSVSATQINSTGNLVVVANTGIDLSGSVRARAFSLASQTGTIDLRAPSNSGNVTVYDASTTSGDVLLTATTGNLVIQNQVATTSGNVSLTATAERLNITAAANISTATNRVLTTSSKTTTFEAGADITTGTLNYTAGNDAGFFNSANASFHTLNAAITGAGNAINVTRSSSLNLTGASTTNAPLNVTLTDGNLNISGAVSAGTGTVNLVVANGTLTSSGALSGGTLNATSSNDATFTNTLTANSTGTVNLTSTSGSINATQTITGKNVTANAAGNLSISGAINGAAGGLANLTSGANLTLSGAIVAGGLTTNSTGAQNIANTVNLATGAANLNSAATLEETWAPRASRRQRRGRAGRTRHGQYWALYSRAQERRLPEQAPPEILRVPLENLYLQVMALGL